MVLAQIFLGPSFKVQMMGASVLIAPFGYHPIALVQGLSFEASYVGDFFAPNKPIKNLENFVLDDERRLIKRQENTAQGLILGVSNEYTVLSFLRLRPYISIGQLWLSGLNTYGAGLNLGHDAVIDFLPGRNMSLLVLKTEGRLFSNSYWPTYFGPTYLIDRHVQNQSETKSQWLSKTTDGARVGYLVGLNYFFDNWLSMSLNYENAHSLSTGLSAGAMHKLQMLGNINIFDFLKLSLGYQSLGTSEFEQLFDFDKSRGLLSLRTQVKLASMIYFDGWAKHAFGVKDSFLADKNNILGEPMWLSNEAETRSLNFGLGLELSMTF